MVHMEYEYGNNNDTSHHKSVISLSEHVFPKHSKGMPAGLPQGFEACSICEAREISDLEIFAPGESFLVVLDHNCKTRTANERSYGLTDAFVSSSSSSTTE